MQLIQLLVQILVHSALFIEVGLCSCEVVFALLASALHTNQWDHVSTLEETSQFCPQPVNLRSHDVISLVVSSSVFHFPLSLSHPGQRIVLLRDGVVIVRLQCAVFFEERLVDLLEGSLFGKNSTSVGLQMVVVIIASDTTSSVLNS